MNIDNQKYRKIKNIVLQTDQSKSSLQQYQAKTVMNIKNEKERDSSVRFAYFKKNDNEDEVEQKLSGIYKY